MRCEQIAVACLVAHGDMTRNSIQKDYKPQIIMAELAKKTSIPLATGAVGMCPLYSVLGLSTCAMPKKA